MATLLNNPINSGYPSRVTIPSTINIASGATVSDIIQVPVGASIAGIVFPTAFTGSTIGFNGSEDGVNFYPMCDPTTGSPLSLTVPLSLTSGAWSALAPATLCGPRFVQITCTAQGAARVLQIMPRVFF